MNILSHRGYWNISAEKNTLIAFKRSFSNGFGTEMDVRDYQGELVISHDIANKKNVSLESFFKLYKTFDNELFIALNIKADGLQLKIKKLLDHYKIFNYSVFDTSVPDGLGYLKYNIKLFTRQSEYEKEPSFYESAVGVWLDEFHDQWIDKKIIKFHKKNNKKICIVSPDLHNREHLKGWERFKQIEKELGMNDLIICTDHPEEARRFFDAV